MKDSNRDQIEHIPIKLNAIKCALQSLSDFSRGRFRFTNQEVEHLAVLEHELRSPLMPILAWIEVLKQESTSSSSLQRAIHAIERNVMRQRALVSVSVWICPPSSAMSSAGMRRRKPSSQSVRSCALSRSRKVPPVASALGRRDIGTRRRARRPR